MTNRSTQWMHQNEWNAQSPAQRRERAADLAAFLAETEPSDTQPVPVPDAAWAVPGDEEPEFVGNSPFCPRCGEFDEGEPVKRFDFKGFMGERDWREVHKCPDCGKMYEYINGD
jgi:hypothetical protein